MSVQADGNSWKCRAKHITSLLYSTKLTLYGITRSQSIGKSKQISGQTILSSPHNLEFNPNFAKNRDIPVVKNSVIYTRPATPAV